MRKSKLAPKASSAGRTKRADGTTRPRVLPKSLQPSAATEGVSIFKVALGEAGLEHLQKAHDPGAPLDPKLPVELYQKTGNPVWVWTAIAQARQLQDIPPEAFEYLHCAAIKMYEQVMAQLLSREMVRIAPIKESDKTVSRGHGGSPVRADIPHHLSVSAADG